MYTVKLMVPAAWDDETGWDFKTEEEAEAFLKKMKFIKMGKVGCLENVWRGCVCARGSAKYIPILSIEKKE